MAEKVARFAVELQHYGTGDIDFDMVKAIVEKAPEIYSDLMSVAIRANEVRKADGFLMYVFNIISDSGSKLSMGCVQRKIGGEYEFHS